MAISNAFRPVYNEFCARETVIRANSSDELPPFEVTGDMVGFRFVMTTFDNGEIDAARAAADVTSAIGAGRISSENRLAAVTARTQALVDAEIGATGVDTDFELQQLILIEQAFAANARVIQIADRLIQQLVEL